MQDIDRLSYAIACTAIMYTNYVLYILLDTLSYSISNTISNTRYSRTIVMYRYIMYFIQFLIAMRSTLTNVVVWVLIHDYTILIWCIKYSIDRRCDYDHIYDHNRNHNRNNLQDFVKVHDTTCVICMCNAKVAYRHSVCKHDYHKRCINTWISRKNNCPTCRRRINFIS